MTIFRRSVKVVMTQEDILALKPKRGIDIVFQPIHTNSSIYIATISGTDLNPSNPLEEIEDKELDDFIADQLNVYEDRIRDPKDLKKIPDKARQMAMNINDKRLDDSKYEPLRSKQETQFRKAKTAFVQSLEGRALQKDTDNNPDNFVTIQEG